MTETAGNELERYSFPLKSRGKWFTPTQEQLDGWLQTYRSVDVRAELLAARQWCLANPGRRKINGARFIVAWLKRTMEQGGSSPLAKAAGAEVGRNDIKLPPANLDRVRELVPLARQILDQVRHLEGWAFHQQRFELEQEAGIERTDRDFAIAWAQVMAS